MLGLPLEEALSFLLTCTLVADGLLLAGDPRARSRSRRLLPGVRPSGAARRTVEPWTTLS
ncbi:MAG: hypothetical protein JWM64_1618 [Frankiales bacterium]|nr:hypothetical protein [Frankiales bacterium]